MMFNKEFQLIEKKMDADCIYTFLLEKSNLYNLNMLTHIVLPVLKIILEPKTG